jgi:hypothetical protein
MAAATFVSRDNSLFVKARRFHSHSEMVFRTYSKIALTL